MMTLKTKKSSIPSRKKPRSDFPGQVDFVLGQVKMEVCWSSGQVKLASVVLLVIISNLTKTISKLVTAKMSKTMISKQPLD